MKLSRFFLGIIVLFFWQHSLAQRKLDNFIKSLDNKSLKYDLIVTSPSLHDSTLNISKYLVDIKSVDLKSLMGKFNFQKLFGALVNCLNDSDRDWYANMLLYAITKKDATIFTVIENRNDWIRNGNKNRDLEYWHSLK